jgi:hypothetical protein
LKARTTTPRRETLVVLRVAVTIVKSDPVRVITNETWTCKDIY